MMDATFLHVLAKLDQIRDTQRDHGEIIKSILASRQEKEDKKSGLLSQLQKLPLHWQWIVGGMVSWGISAAIGAYLKNGGDPIKLIEALLKFFGLIVGS
jgi:hypothetical protein